MICAAAATGVAVKSRFMGMTLVNDWPKLLAAGPGQPSSAHTVIWPPRIF
jgi:hypothetical protein